MLHTLRLLIPALIPSWRFFDTIAASPRIEYALLHTADEEPSHWQEFRPRPAHLSIGHMFTRLLWNPRWNESLFMVSCSERLIANPTEHSEQNITGRIIAELQRNKITAPYFQFRLVLVNRNGTALEKNTAYVSVTQCYESSVDA